jgi:hypothetical protein
MKSDPVDLDLDFHHETVTDIASARKFTADAFAALHADPRDAYEFVSAEKRPSMLEAMRARAEMFVAEALGREMVEIDQCDDLDLLRSIWRICHGTDAPTIRDWFKSRDKAERKAEREAKKSKKEEAA